MEPSASRYSILIIGGCGFVGYHLVKHFVQHPRFGPVAVSSRSAQQSNNKVKGAEYHRLDITDCESIKDLLLELKPAIIIHAATPSPITGTSREYDQVTIQGTRHLLQVGTGSGDIKALIYTSSSTLAKGPEHLRLGEDYPLANEDPKSPPYARTKALADIMVLAANSPRSSADTMAHNMPWEGALHTASLRFPIIYGTHDPMSIPGALSALQKRQTNIQLGDGKNIWDFCSVENAALAHSILALALLRSDSDNGANVDGEAFNINDDDPQLFWGYARLIWKFAGHKADNERIWEVPSWIAMGLASILECIFRILTLGTKRPQKMGRQQMEYACFTHTYSITKAKERLGFVPRQDFESSLEKAVQWSLDHDGWADKLRNS